jgi:tetratricopeptide (TPR) repeat protein
VEIKGTPDQWLDWLVGDDEQIAHDAKLALGGLIPEDNVPLEALVDGLTSAGEDVVFWCLSAYLSEHPDSMETLRARGAIYSLAGDFDRALEDLNQALSIDRCK